MLFSADYLCLPIAGRLDYRTFKCPFQPKLFCDSIMLWWWSTLRISAYSRSAHHGQVKELNHLVKSSTFFPISLTCNRKIFFLCSFKQNSLWIALLAAWPLSTFSRSIITEHWQWPVMTWQCLYLQKHKEM